MLLLVVCTHVRCCDLCPACFIFFFFLNQEIFFVKWIMMTGFLFILYFGFLVGTVCCCQYKYLDRSRSVGVLDSEYQLNVQCTFN